jgi:hypothetical protein
LEVYLSVIATHLQLLWVQPNLSTVMVFDS